MSRDGSPATKTYPHPCFVYAARYHPQRNNIVITGGYDRLVRIWRNDSEGASGQVCDIRDDITVRHVAYHQ